MGLDISAIHNLTHRPNPADGEEDYDGVRIFLHGREWADREEGCPDDDARYDFDTIDTTACSYGGYRWMREALVAAAQLGLTFTGLTNELVSERDDWALRLCMYSDCGGCFGPEPVKKIAARLHEIIDGGLLSGSDYLDVWRRWLRVFDAAAAVGGMVRYH